MVLAHGADMLIRRGEDALIEYLNAKMTSPLTPVGEDFMRALYQLATQVTEGVIVELGAYVGRSAIALAWDATVPVYSVDDYIYHLDWSNKSYDAENEEIYRRNIEQAGVKTSLVVKNAWQAWLDWGLPIGLFVWDISVPDRIFYDWLLWRKFIAVGGRALLRDTFDKRLGSLEVLECESLCSDFEIERDDPGLLVLKRIKADTK